MATGKCYPKYQILYVFKIKVVFTPSSYNVSASCIIIYNQTVCPFQYIQTLILKNKIFLRIPKTWIIRGIKHFIAWKEYFLFFFLFCTSQSFRMTRQSNGKKMFKVAETFCSIWPICLKLTMKIFELIQQFKLHL